MGTTTTGETTALDEAVRRLEPVLDGSLITPGDPGYDEARSLWNGMVDRTPSLIVRCAGTVDVQAAVHVAVATDLEIAVRGGGHNVAGTAGVDDGMVIDLSAMDQVVVDPRRRTATVGGGATWADVDSATQEHGLAAPGGLVSDTGVGGLTLGGGVGWLRRRYGMTCDNLLAATIVTADGAVQRVDASSDPELLWGLRGGGGNFGVVTEFTFALHPVGPQVAVAMVVHHASRTSRVLHGWREWASDAPDDVTSMVFAGTVPQEAEYPEESWGEPFLAVMGCAATDVATGTALLRPLRGLAEPLVDMSGSMPYVDLQRLLDADYPDGGRYYWKSLHLPELSSEAIALVHAWARRRPSDLSTIDVWQLGGAMARIPSDATAYGDRSAPFLLGIEANWTDPANDDANIAWARECASAFAPVSTGREYLNFPGFLEDHHATLRLAHGADNYGRLGDLKRRTDPENRFALHNNVPPS